MTKWLACEAASDLRRATLKATSPWYLEEVLAQCWKTGNLRGRLSIHEIQQRGYGGSYPHLERLLAGWPRAEKHAAVDRPTISRKLEPVKDQHTGHAVSNVISAALCIKPRGISDPRSDAKG